LKTKTLSVLVVDDDSFNQEIAIDLLSSLGHTGVVVGNGEKALLCLSQRHFDVVLMDIMMPIMDGLATLAAIRAKEKLTRQHVQVIMATGHTEPGDGARLIQAGADGYITKPLGITALRLELARLFSAS
jgi:CheY-like chemotaxis protein